MKNFWFNLPVKDVVKAKKFYRAIGFRENPMHSNNEQLGSFFIGEQNVVLMLFTEKEFSQFTQANISNTKNGCEALFNLDAQSKEEVDNFTKIVEEAGGEIYAKPTEINGWMYPMGFADPDGHRWSVMYMDRSKMPNIPKS